MKVIYRETTSAEVGLSLRAYDPGLKVSSIQVRLSSGEEVSLRPIAAPEPKLWILEKMSAEGLTAYYFSRDFANWHPHPVEAFDRQGVAHQAFGLSDRPAVEHGDILVLLSSSGAAELFEVSVPAKCQTKASVAA
jgi:hypothetical protein